MLLAKLDCGHVIETACEASSMLMADVTPKPTWSRGSTDAQSIAARADTEITLHQGHSDSSRGQTSSCIGHGASGVGLPPVLAGLSRVQERPATRTSGRREFWAACPARALLAGASGFVMRSPLFITSTYHTLSQLSATSSVSAVCHMSGTAVQLSVTSFCYRRHRSRMSSAGGLAPAVKCDSNLTTA